MLKLDDILQQYQAEISTEAVASRQKLKSRMVQINSDIEHNLGLMRQRRHKLERRVERVGVALAEAIDNNKLSIKRLKKKTAARRSGRARGSSEAAVVRDLRELGVKVPSLRAGPGGLAPPREDAGAGAEASASLPPPRDDMDPYNTQAKRWPQPPVSRSVEFDTINGRSRRLQRGGAPPAPKSPTPGAALPSLTHARALDASEARSGTEPAPEPQLEAWELDFVDPYNVQKRWPPKPYEIPSRRLQFGIITGSSRERARAAERRAMAEAHALSEASASRGGRLQPLRRWPHWSHSQLMSLDRISPAHAPGPGAVSPGAATSLGGSVVGAGNATLSPGSSASVCGSAAAAEPEPAPALELRDYMDPYNVGQRWPTRRDGWYSASDERTRRESKQRAQELAQRSAARRRAETLAKSMAAAALAEAESAVRARQAEVGAEAEADVEAGAPAQAQARSAVEELCLEGELQEQEPAPAAPAAARPPSGSFPGLEARAARSGVALAMGNAALVPAPGPDASAEAGALAAAATARRLFEDGVAGARGVGQLLSQQSLPRQVLELAVVVQDATDFGADSAVLGLLEAAHRGGVRRRESVYKRRSMRMGLGDFARLVETDEARERRLRAEAEAEARARCAYFTTLNLGWAAARGGCAAASAGGGTCDRTLSAAGPAAVEKLAYVCAVAAELYTELAAERLKDMCHFGGKVAREERHRKTIAATRGAPNVPSAEELQRVRRERQLAAWQETADYISQLNTLGPTGRSRWRVLRFFVRSDARDEAKREAERASKHRHATARRRFTQRVAHDGSTSPATPGKRKLDFS
eukprot:g4278.t1